MSRISLKDETVIIPNDATFSSTDALQAEERRSTGRQNISILRRRGIQPKRFTLSLVERADVYDKIFVYEGLVGKIVRLDHAGISLDNLMVTEASCAVSCDGCFGLHTLQVTLNFTQSVEVKPRVVGPVRLV